MNELIIYGIGVICGMVIGYWLTPKNTGVPKINGDYKEPITGGVDGGVFYVRNDNTKIIKSKVLPPPPIRKDFTFTPHEIKVTSQPLNYASPFIKRPFTIQDLL